MFNAVHAQPPQHRHQLGGASATCCGNCRGGAVGCAETPVVRLNPHDPIAHRIIIAAALAGESITVVERASDDVAAPSVCIRGRCVEGADAGTMYLVRHAANAAAMASIFGDNDDARTPQAGLPLLPVMTAPELHRVRDLIAKADALAALQLAAAAARPRDVKRAKADAAECFVTLEAALRDMPAFEHVAAGPFIAGSEPSVADSAIVPLVARQMTLTMGACVDGCPRLWALYEAACRRSPDVADSVEEFGFDLDGLESFAEAWHQHHQREQIRL